MSALDDFDARINTHIGRLHHVVELTLDAYITLARATEHAITALDGEAREKLMQALEESTIMLGLAASP